jgi:hypothetical protein
MAIEIVINTTFGGFSLTDEMIEYLSKEGIEANQWGDDLPRDSAALVAAVKATTGHDLKVVEIPSDARWYVDNYDGVESIREGRTWR